MSPSSSRPPRLPRATRQAVTRLVDVAWDALERDAPAEARARWAEAQALAPDHPDVLWLGADLAMADEDWPRARARLEALLVQQPDLADAHDALARVFEQLGQIKAMTAHALRVHALDARADRRRAVGTPQQLQFIEEEVRRVLASVPEQLAARLRNVPIVLEPRPSFALVREGFDPRALGLFEGTTDGGIASDTVVVSPTRIVLFYANLLAICDDPESLAEEIEITVLHEIGHFFGLSEDEVDALGLA